MFVPIIVGIAIVLGIAALAGCARAYRRTKGDGEPKAPSSGKMSAKEMRIMALHDQAWAKARSLEGEIRALADGKYPPEEAPGLCLFLACLVAGELAQPAAPPVPCERTD